MTLSPERQWYLLDNISQYVPERGQDILCPKPEWERVAYAQVRAAKEKQHPIEKKVVFLKSVR